jgi:hypothetical protein
MRILVVIYCAAAIWTLGWLAATFGVGPSLLIGFVLGIPGFVGWRMTRSVRQLLAREYVYLAILFSVAITGAGYVTTKWYSAGMDRLALFERESKEFRLAVANDPAFHDVEVSFTSRKGGRIYLHGSVASKAVHDRLIEMAKQTVRNNDGSYHDGVRALKD